VWWEVLMNVFQRIKHWRRRWSEWWKMLMNVFQRMKHWHRNRSEWWEMFSRACLFQVEELFVYVKMRMSWRFESCSRRQWKFFQEWRTNTKYKIQRMLWKIISRLRLFYVEETCDLHQHKTKKWRIWTTKRSNVDVSSSIIVKECSRTISKKTRSKRRWIISIIFISWISELVNSLTVELGFGQKFKPDPRIDVRPDWTDQSSQFDLKIDVRRVLSSLFETSYI
jgi:hypothetical protein